MKNIAILGAGGHAKVIIDLIKELNQYSIVGIYDDNKTGYFSGIKILGKISELDKKIENYVIGIGSDKVRKMIYKKYKDLNWPVLIHPRSIVSKTVEIEKGTVVFAGSVIQTEVKIGKFCIINTNCNIDHECMVGNYTSICPGSTICGQVIIGNLVFIGANSTVIQCLKIEDNSIIGAGSVIIKNVNKNSKIVGNPGKILYI
jgi:sugar O-acyltransferase (sialic acid O-acetyltransferase NeuD family)